MIFIPPTPEHGGEMLRAYVAAEPHRRPIFDNVRARLDPNGRVGDHARYYIVVRPQRRAVFRGILLCTHYLIPDWAKDNPDAAAANRAFTEQHWEHYHSFHAALTATPVEAARAD